MLIFNIPLAGLGALIVLFLAIIQLPLTLILGPVLIYGFSMLGETQAIIFLLLNIIIGFSDTILKKIFMGRGVDIPVMVLLLGAIGGIMLSGMIGLFLGAVILSLTYKVYQSLIAQTSLPAEEAERP
jgi:predicted PurR-regulated permease PerM